ncbi:MAG: hypothetical protein BWK79_16580 [Beggiatoa sp. IS2]|nr:MAG: hypothetical protein BWK79_16580 [Beggiatoa sp. IS2]
MKTLKDYSTEELKLIYNLLYAQLLNHPKLIDSALLQDIQHYLLNQAVQEGVDISQHTDWANWLIQTSR